MSGSVATVMNADEAKRLKALELENAKLKKMRADRMLEIDVLSALHLPDLAPVVASLRSAAQSLARR